MARTPDPNSKAGFVRAQPATMSAPDVVAAAKAKGITLAVQYVRTQRSRNKRLAGAASGASPMKHGRSRSRTATAGPAAPVGQGDDIGALIESIVERKVEEMLHARFKALLTR